MFPTTYATSASLSEPARVGDRHTVPARNPSVGIPSKATGLPGIMFATLGVSPAGLLGRNPYHPSPKVTNIRSDQISHSVGPHPEVRGERREPLADKTWESTLLSRSGGGNKCVHFYKRIKGGP